ncbi:hypothetical protein ACF0H5_016939 [Mactra antiquata]
MVRRLSTHYDRHKRSAECDFPPLLRFEFNVNDVHIVLNLEKNTHIQHNVPIYVPGENGQAVREDIDDTEKYSLYQDINHGSAMLVSCEEDASYRLLGSFRYEGVLYHMTPSNTPEVNKDHTIHTEHKDKLEYGNDAIDSANMNANSLGNNTSRQKRATIPSGNVVEMVFAIDYYTYNYYLTDQGTQAAAEDALRRHITLLANEMDIYYAGIPSVDSSVDIRIYVSGIYINTNSTTSDWSSVSQVTVNGVPYLPFTNVVNNLRSWLLSQSGLPPYDHVMTMSVIEFADVNNGVVSSTGLTGVAFLGTVCDASSVSFTQLEYHGRTAQTMAHELGHALNSQHDGTGNSCGETNYNVMTPTFYITASSTYAAAQWTFSSCSVSYFKSYISGLSSNCMQSHSFSQSNYNSMVAYGLPGQYYSTTDQCAMYEGPSSVPCSITDTVTSSDCYNGYRCSDPTLGCSSSSTLYPMAGTKCGDSSLDYICYKGQCVDRTVIITTTTTTSTTPSTTSTTSSTTSTTSSTTSTTSSTTSTTPSTSPTTSSTTSSTTSTTPSTTSTTPSTTSTSTTTTTATPTTKSPCKKKKKCCTKVRIGKKFRRKCCRGPQCCSRPKWFSSTKCYQSCCTVDTTTSTTTTVTTPTTSTSTTSTTSTVPTPTTSTTTLSTTTTPEPVCTILPICCVRSGIGFRCCFGTFCCNRSWATGTQCYQNCCVANGEPVGTDD